MPLTDKQLERYSRHIVLPEINSSGQEKLIKSSVLVAGAGGLGSAALYYLAACGVGTLGIVDYDKVALTNLHRQIIHYSDDLNKFKVTSAEEKITKLNPDIKVKTFNQRLDKNNIENVLSNFEIIVDGLDNFNDKFLLNDYCVKLKKKLIHAGVIGFEGQILTVIPKESACLRCLFPAGQPEDNRQSCKETGVLSTCVGVLSTLQANEVIKLVLGIGKPYTNRVLKFNALEGTFYELKINGISKICPVCALEL